MREGARNAWVVVLSILAALILTIVPLPQSVEAFRPDWIALVLLYWALYWPQRVGMGTAWICGLIIDTLKGTVLGQHALAISVVMFLAMKFHLRIRVFPLGQQTVTVLGLLAIYQFLLFWIDGVVDQSDVLLYRWGAVLVGTLMWPPVRFSLSKLKQPG